MGQYEGRNQGCRAVCVRPNASLELFLNVRWNHPTHSLCRQYTIRPNLRVLQALAFNKAKTMISTIDQDSKPPFKIACIDPEIPCNVSRRGIRPCLQYADQFSGLCNACCNRASSWRRRGRRKPNSYIGTDAFIGPGSGPDGHAMVQEHSRQMKTFV